MKVTKQNLPVMSSWLVENQNRLDASPFLSGAFEARVILEGLKAKKEPLQSLTQGGINGIFKAPRLSPQYVENPDYGHPYLSSSDILCADLSCVPNISKKQANELEKYFVRYGMTLLTSSGNIGRPIFAREEMDGMMGSPHFMRVNPDHNKILSGYLYAFLASKFGQVLVKGNTYGSIIVAIEPHHLFDLPVPRLGAKIEGKVHDLIVEASRLRTEASKVIKRAIGKTQEIWGIDANFTIRKNINITDTFFINFSELNNRLDGFYHCTPARVSDQILKQISSNIDIKKMSEVVENIFETTRFGRICVESEHGIPFLSISDLLQFAPQAETFISKKQANLVKAQVKSNWIILPRVGQIKGVFGHPTYILPHLDGVAISDNNIRIVPKNDIDSGYIFAVLSTSISYWQIVRQACGTSIPYLDTNRLGEMPIPWAKKEIRLIIAKDILLAMQNRSEAVKKEQEAIKLVEKTIEEGTQ